MCLSPGGKLMELAVQCMSVPPPPPGALEGWIIVQLVANGTQKIAVQCMSVPPPPLGPWKADYSSTRCQWNSENRSTVYECTSPPWGPGRLDYSSTRCQWNSENRSTVYECTPPPPGALEGWIIVQLVANGSQKIAV